MIKPLSSLFTKILCWFFLNLVLVGVALGIFFTFQSQMNIYSLFGQQGTNRLRSAGMLIAYDLQKMPRAEWAAVLARHAGIHQVDFALVLEDGSRFFSADMEIPEIVITKAMDMGPEAPRHTPSPLRGAPGDFHGPPKDFFNADDLMPPPPVERKPPVERRPFMLPNPVIHPDAYERKAHLILRTKHPTRYWSGMRIPLAFNPFSPPVPAMLLAVSDSATGNGFFFDPLPWMSAAGTVILISVLFWVPMIRYITSPLTRMTRATEEIAKGCFDVSIQEARADEIGRLAKAINYMTSRLSAFVKGQKRFLGDVAHELGSPISRIHFGLAVLEARTRGENRKRLLDIMEDVDHMSRLVNELLAFSRAEMNAATVKLEKIKLFPVVQEAIKREVTSGAQIVVKVDREICVVASAELLTRALANLIRNAVKYAGDTGPIHVLAEKRKDEITMEVRDSGPGVSDNFLHQLFEPFFRLEPSRNRDSGGVGLGLAIVKTCIETCRGTVSARNMESGGFAVTMVLKTKKHEK